MRKSLIEEHRVRNLETLVRTRLLPEEGPIEDQAAWGGVAYGSHRRSDMAYSGCGVIAMCNVLVVLGDVPERGVQRIERFLELVGSFEKRALVMGGAWGSRPRVAMRLLEELGGYYSERTYAREPERLDGLGERYDAFLVTAMNDKNDIRKMIHTVCIEKRIQPGKQVAYIIHNGYVWDGGGYRESRPYSGLHEAAEHVGRDALPLYTIGVRRR